MYKVICQKPIGKILKSRTKVVIYVQHHLQIAQSRWANSKMNLH